MNTKLIRPNGHALFTLELGEDLIQIGFPGKLILSNRKGFPKESVFLENLVFTVTSESALHAPPSPHWHWIKCGLRFLLYLVKFGSKVRGQLCDSRK